ncbi:MAG: hypothetical protein LBP38_00405, partial [Desulfovibrio sp.]|nr:hypothetical protein [Desulfovibrio sp.]
LDVPFLPANPRSRPTKGMGPRAMNRAAFAGSNTGLITPFQKHGIFCGILPGLIRNIRTISGNNRVISSLLNSG